MTILQLKELVFQAKLKDRSAMVTAAKRMDFFRKKYGKSSQAFHSVSAIRKLRDGQ